MVCVPSMRRKSQGEIRYDDSIDEIFEVGTSDKHTHAFKQFRTRQPGTPQVNKASFTLFLVLVLVLVFIFIIFFSSYLG